MDAEKLPCVGLLDTALQNLVCVYGGWLVGCGGVWWWWWGGMLSCQRSERNGTGHRKAGVWLMLATGGGDGGGTRAVKTAKVTT